MRNFIDIVTETTDTLTSDETKFWYNVNEHRFIDHDIDTHHTRMVAQEPENFGLTPDDVAHHPHAHGDYMAGWQSEEEFDDENEAEEDAEIWADNNDMGLFAKAFALGWVRGGHEMDIMSYHEFGELRHEGRIYLQSPNIKDLRKTVRACMKRWPDIEGFRIESEEVPYFELNADQIDRFVKFGTVPKPIR